MKRLTKIIAPVLLAGLALVPAVLAQGTPIGEADASAGETVFNGSCVACHQATGAGIPGAFPPLAGHLPEVVSLDGGRPYVIDVVLYGLTGAINVHGAAYNGMMTPWASVFDDDQIAAVLNYVATAWGNADALPEGFAAFTADEVAAQRATAKDSAAVYGERQALGLE